MEIIPQAIPGLHLVRSPVRADARGAFTKVFQRGEFAADGLACDFRESYWSRSAAGVIRGLHFQAPPHDHAKLVYCAVGEILDVVLDIRVGSPTCGTHLAFSLDAGGGEALHLAPGLAHGFQARSDGAVVVYLVTSEHAPAADAGVRWDSAGIAWDPLAPIVSERDRSFPTLRDLASPFRFAPEQP